MIPEPKEGTTITVLVTGGAGDVATVYASPDKSAEELGWKAELTLRDTCRDAWNWQSPPMGYESE